MGSPVRRLKCLCGRVFDNPDERTAWRALQDHVAEFAAMDETLHGLDEQDSVEWLHLSDLSNDEILATHAEDLSNQATRRRRQEWTPSDEAEFVLHLIRYLAMMLHRQHDRSGMAWTKCTVQSCRLAQQAQEEV
jgi:hypothetical protein